MEITLIRHTTPKIAKGICYGQSDIDIIDTFLEEIKPILKEVPINNLETTYYSSPLLRCKKLAEKLSDTVIYDNRLKELDFGDWELKNWDAINKVELDIWMTDFVNVSATNGESYIGLHARTTDFLSEIVVQNHQKIVIVAHAGVIRSLNAFIKKIPLEKSFDLKLQYGEILKLNY
ncbi:MULTISPECIES: alpha-ribazole phosphatase family protein [unclassified Polaribacter]|uniref:alpha-ribazole phosphatase family protein n=1 Tax=unclassified Polaribacter TaxID=196858 RepID=UPI00167AF15A|nr:MULTISPECIES: alpha-ribazole phosphatase family protein [unclassified Polaribacter]